MLRLLKTRGQNRLPQCLRALEVGIDLGFDFADDGQVAVDFGDDRDLGFTRWQGNQNTSELVVRKANAAFANSRFVPINGVHNLGSI